MTRREAMLAALEARLQSLTATVPELRVERNRRADIVHAPTLVLRDGDQETDAEQTEYKTHAATPRIDGFVTAPSDAEIGPAVNALYGAIIDALEADPGLAGTADDVLERGFATDFSPDEGGKLASCWFALQLQIPYTASREDSSVP